jgi:hypothetical protein
MDWAALAVLGLIWAILLLPEPRASRSRRLKMPIEQEFRHPGRWILSPRRGSRFVGPHARERERARERRRRVFVFFLEAIGLTGLIGVFPPLRGMLFVTALFAVLLLAYSALVLKMIRGAPVAESNGHSRPSRNVVILPEIQVQPDPLLEEQDRRLVRLAR